MKAKVDFVAPWGRWHWVVFASEDMYGTAESVDTFADEAEARENFFKALKAMNKAAEEMRDGTPG